MAHFKIIGKENRDKKDEDAIKENEFFIENLVLFLRNADYIINKPQLHFCAFGSAYLGFAYFGVKYIPLGVLLSLWEENELIDECPDCGKRFLIIGTGGSPLSGPHEYWGYCEACKKLIYSKKKSFSSVYNPLLKKQWEDKSVKALNIYDLVKHLIEKENYTHYS